MSFELIPHVLMLHMLMLLERMLLLWMPLEVKLQVLVFSNLYVDVSFANVS
jgi:hypothetical protein